MGEYQDNYFFNGLKLKKEKLAKEKQKHGNNKKKQDEDRYNISIERRPHYCSHASEDINNNNKTEEGISNNIDINKEIESNVILNNNNNEINTNNKKKNINKINEQISNTSSAGSVKTDIEEINYEEDMK